MNVNILPVNWKTKILIYLLILLAGIFIYYHMIKSAEIEALQEERVKEIKKVKEDEGKKQDSILNLMEIQEASLQEEVIELQKQTKKLNQILKYYENRPDLDLDFVTSAGIISESSYQLPE